MCNVQCADWRPCAVQCEGVVQCNVQFAMCWLKALCSCSLHCAMCNELIEGLEQCNVRELCSAMCSALCWLKALYSAMYNVHWADWSLVLIEGLVQLCSAMCNGSAQFPDWRPCICAVQSCEQKLVQAAFKSQTNGRLEPTFAYHPSDIPVTIKYQMVKMSVIFESCTKVLMSPPPFLVTVLSMYGDRNV